MVYPVYKPYMHGNEKEYVMDCLDSTWISSKGKYIDKFQTLFADSIGVKEAITVANGTVALHVALEALGVGPGDEVIVPSYTYIASVNAIAYTGAKPVFVDSLLDDWMMDVSQVENVITSNTKAIMAVHLYGGACDLEALMRICNKHDVFLIEDCAESFGTTYNGKHTGCFGDIATFSFFGNKTITTGEGGMVVTNNAELAYKVTKLKGQGLADRGEYWHDVLGYNYRMTNICAALGVAQLEQQDLILKKKREIATWYREFLDLSYVSFHKEEDHIESSFWIICIVLKEASLRDNLREVLRENGIDTRPFFNPAHIMPVFNESIGKYPNAEILGKSGLNLPSYPDLEREDVKLIAEVINKHLSSQ